MQTVTIAPADVATWHPHLVQRLPEVRDDAPFAVRDDDEGNGADDIVRQLRHAYRASCGVAVCDEVARLLRSHSDQPISQLARWIVSRQLVSFVWRSQTLIPLFQLDFTQMSVRPSVQQVIAELSDVFDDWDLANWFVRPNSGLAGSTPVKAISTDLPAVLQAARADRFVAIG
jgi:hypothetical protein